jgi:transcriptional regulator with XRE-family HTH domain
MARSGFEERFPANSSLVAKALVRNVRRLRKDKGWTEDELAAKLRIDQTAVSLIENARSNPTLQTLEQIAVCLSVRFIDLFATHPQKSGVCVPKIRFGVDAASGRRKLAS